MAVSSGSVDGNGTASTQVMLTVPSNTIYRVKQIHVADSASVVSVTPFSVTHGTYGSVGTAKFIVPNTTQSTGGNVYDYFFSPGIVLAAADTLQGVFTTSQTWLVMYDAYTLS